MDKFSSTSLGINQYQVDLLSCLRQKGQVQIGCQVSTQFICIMTGKQNSDFVIDESCSLDVQMGIELLAIRIINKRTENICSRISMNLKSGSAN